MHGLGIPSSSRDCGGHRSHCNEGLGAPGMGSAAGRTLHLSAPSTIASADQVTHLTLDARTDWCQSVKAQPLCPAGDNLKWPFHSQTAPCSQPRLSLDCIAAGSFPLPTSAPLTPCPQMQTPKALPGISLPAKLGLSLHPGNPGGNRDSPCLKPL